ncbi:hypothetical protein CASFOL_018007 [Castilleja foliolosa]|uniref:Heat shock protein 70 n=1 Tax=Castilleja foliolosa TaxID=1961234 RepID=A0ABD3D8X3_9LAMI
MEYKASSMVVLSFAVVQLFCHYHLTLKLLKKAVPTDTVELEVVRAVNVAFKSREDHRKQLELEEARKVGLAPAELDDDGNKIKPHIPQYMSARDEAAPYDHVTELDCDGKEIKPHNEAALYDHVIQMYGARDEAAGIEAAEANIAGPSKSTRNLGVQPELLIPRMCTFIQPQWGTEVQEREFVRDNKSLGSFRLDGIPPAPRGVPQIEVKFDIDANGILSVATSDKGSGKKQDITITGASTLPSDEVERMVSEAERFSKEDKEKRDAIDTKNQANSVVYQTEKVEAKLGELKEAISGGSTQAIKDAITALNQEVMQLGQSLYNQPGGSGSGTGPTPGGEPGPSESSEKGPEGDVIDADFTDTK